MPVACLALAIYGCRPILALEVDKENVLMAGTCGGLGIPADNSPKTKAQVEALDCYVRAFPALFDNDLGTDFPTRSVSVTERRALLEKAVGLTDQALAIKKDPWTFRMKAVFLSELGQYDYALITVEQALALDPDEGLNLKGEILARTGNYKEALRCFEKAKTPEIRTSDKYVFANIARANIKLGNFSLADDAIDECLRINGEFAEAYELRAQVISRTVDGKERKQLLDELLNRYRHAIWRPNAFGYLNECPKEPMHRKEYRRLKALFEQLKEKPIEEPARPHLL